MVQFSGREEDLIDTLRAMQEKSIAQRATAAVRRSAKHKMARTGDSCDVSDDSSEDDSSDLYINSSNYDGRSMASSSDDSSTDRTSITNEFLLGDDEDGYDAQRQSIMTDASSADENSITNEFAGNGDDALLTTQIHHAKNEAPHYSTDNSSQGNSIVKDALSVSSDRQSTVPLNGGTAGSEVEESVHSPSSTSSSSVSVSSSVSSNFYESSSERGHHSFSDKGENVVTIKNPPVKNSDDVEMADQPNLPSTIDMPDWRAVSDTAELLSGDDNSDNCGGSRSHTTGFSKVSQEEFDKMDELIDEGNWSGILEAANNISRASLGIDSIGNGSSVGSSHNSESYANHQYEDEDFSIDSQSDPSDDEDVAMYSKDTAALLREKSEFTIGSDAGSDPSNLSDMDKDEKQNIDSMITGGNWTEVIDTASIMSSDPSCDEDVAMYAEDTAALKREKSEFTVSSDDGSDTSKFSNVDKDEKEKFDSIIREGNWTGVIGTASNMSRGSLGVSSAMGGSSSSRSRASTHTPRAKAATSRYNLEPVSISDSEGDSPYGHSRVTQDERGKIDQLMNRSIDDWDGVINTAANMRRSTALSSAISVSSNGSDSRASNPLGLYVSDDEGNSDFCSIYSSGECSNDKGMGDTPVRKGEIACNWRDAEHSVNQLRRKSNIAQTEKEKIDAMIEEGNWSGIMDATSNSSF